MCDEAEESSCAISWRSMISRSSVDTRAFLGDIGSAMLTDVFQGTFLVMF